MVGINTFLHDCNYKIHQLKLMNSMFVRPNPKYKQKEVEEF